MPSWSPDGRLIVFTTSRGWEKHGGGSPKRIRNLYVITPDGTGLTQLTDGNTYTTSPHWGRDNWIYFASNQAGNLDIWRLKPAGEWGTLQPVGAEDWSPPPDAEPAEPTEPTGGEPATAGEPAPESPAPEGGCTKDMDCKGDRICEKGKCVSPK
jgi:Tol biopolymer transport system component